MTKRDELYTDFSTVESQKTMLNPEEYPEGPFGSPIGKNDPVTNKETPWTEGQQFNSAYTYENRNFHEDLPRQFPGTHPTHDESNKDREEPFENISNGNS